jgi:predicted O-methyltransferase YrrM
MLDGRVREVLRRLEEEDRADLARGLSAAERSRAVEPTTGTFLYALCAGHPSCEVLEVGGSYGYSAVWLGAAVRLLGGHVTSLEIEPARLERSTRNIADAGLDEWVEILPGNAYETIPPLSGPFDLVFIDAEKEDYEAYFRLVRAKLEPGAIVVADNVLSHQDALAAYSAARQADPALLSVTLPLDRGLELTSVLTGSLE